MFSIEFDEIHASRGHTMNVNIYGTKRKKRAITTPKNLTKHLRNGRLHHC